ncbi:hypothetical protein E3T26_13935 [Cryobacterium sp. TMT1-21]|uniref:Fungal lipase-like domain-containing protein n=1 Tax=Cryobacterium shii TaxID=1259235 RepID=A0AAQ2C4Q8_9MICO|nr:MULTISPECIES: hypothetical protein [Cryobacterium]TFC43419.1 hypothetical protein E3O49_13235 [Cryobacterium shii]TFC89587.1 hypothetical protein E3T24_00765 [Cryobacterium sp. TmT2-59]TFD10461.1 hypothetical protein E3T26_13935 [Cryobacterium sp. TMT1-21]TFD20219.1 hypothetical protein E3T32_09300 [Cryobacterium sp. TMT2-23]
MQRLAGDPAVVLETGLRYADTATAIRAAVRQLTAIANPDAMHGLAIARVRSDAAALAADISQAESRYSETGDALVAYAAALEAAQDDADQAIAEFEAAADDLNDAERVQSRLRVTQLAETLADALIVTAPPPPRTTTADLARVTGSISGLSDRKDAAERRYHQACEDRDRAAVNARNRIVDVVAGSDLNDSIWDDISGFLTAVADFIGQAIDVIVSVLAAIVLAVLALVAAVILLIAAVVAFGLAVLALVAAAAIALAVIAVALALAVAVAVVLVLAAAIVAATAIALALAVIVAAAVVLTVVLAHLAIFLAATVYLATALILQGGDPLDSLVQSAIVALMATVPVAWLLVGAAGWGERAEPKRVAHRDAKLVAHASFETMFQDLMDIDDAGHTNDEKDTNQESVVRITTITGPNGELIYKIAVPSTQQWLPGGTSANDGASDAAAKMVLGQRTQLEKAVMDAMKQQEIPDGAHVMLTGWSLGGITAGNLAADPVFSRTYKVDALVTAGASLDDMPIPLHTKVLDVSHLTDPVPRTENPFLADHSNDGNRYKIDVPAPGGAGEDLGHNPEKYQETFRTHVDKATGGAVLDFKAAGGSDSSVGIADYFGDAVDGDDYSYTRG